MDLATELGEQGFRWIFVVHLHGGAPHNQALNQASEYFEDTQKGNMVNLTGHPLAFEARRAEVVKLMRRIGQSIPLPAPCAGLMRAVQRG